VLEVVCDVSRAAQVYGWRPHDGIEECLTLALQGEGLGQGV
jgi:nucleoside-diphosphate-sugar epimerase